MTWSQGALLAEKASVPDVIRTSKGEFRAYWVDFSSYTVQYTEKIGVARSADGSTWELLGTVDFSGLGNRVPVDPDVVELPDGSLRIYFLDFSTAGGQAGMHEICSAVSTDGIHFTVEAGIRLSSASIFDPDIIRLSGGTTYRMYLNAGDVVSASGSDGLIFTMDQGKRVERGGIPGAIVLPDGRVWLYCSGNALWRLSHGLQVPASVDQIAVSSVIRHCLHDWKRPVLHVA